MLQQEEYTVISYFPSPRQTQPLCCSTDPRMWKNWLTLSSSELPETEFMQVNAAFTNLDAEERSPGIPIAPILHKP